MHKPNNKRCSCGAIVEVGKRCRQCREHEKLYKLAIWCGKKGIRRHVLNEEPLCQYCINEGRCVKATIVDHIVPHKGDWELFTNRRNLQSLCKRCHDKKSFGEA